MPRDGRAREITDGAAARPTHICMHVVGVARTDQRVLREARALRDAGYEVTIVDVERDPHRPREEDFQGLRLRHIIMPSRFKRTRFKPFFLVKQAAMTTAGTRLLLATPTDIYHAHDANALLATYRAARRARKTLVFDAHEIPYVEPNFKKYKLLVNLMTQRIRRMMPYCAAVITVSEHIADDLRQRYGGKRAIVVRNMLNYTPPVESDRLREHLGLPATTRIALYQGNFQSDRGLDTVVHAAKYLGPDAVIVLMGQGPMEASLRALAEREGVTERLKILPAVPYSELLSWTASADLGLIMNPPVSPNAIYCLPNKLFEFMMAGVPILANHLVEVEAVLTRYDSGAIIPSGEPEAIGQAITRMLADPAALARMRQNALAACQRDFSWEHEQRRLVDLYAGLVGMERTPADTAPTQRGTAGAQA